VRAFVLFDIDLTLLDSGGAGLEAMNRAFLDLHGVPGAFDGIPFTGRTDSDLLQEALALHERDGPDPEPGARAFHDAYVGQLEQVLGERAGRLMPGVRDLLERLGAEPGLALGLATGNYRRGADLKLAHYGLAGLLREGGFGDDAPQRERVVAVAAQRLAAACGLGSVPPAVLVVGDTPRDMEAATANGFLGIGVATGFYDAWALRAAGARLVLDDFADHQAAAQVLLALIDEHAPERVAGRPGGEGATQRGDGDVDDADRPWTARDEWRPAAEEADPREVETPGREDGEEVAPPDEPAAPEPEEPWLPEPVEPWAPEAAEPEVREPVQPWGPDSGEPAVAEPEAAEVPPEPELVDADAPEPESVEADLADALESESAEPVTVDEPPPGLEREVKYAVSDPAALDALYGLHGLPGGYALLSGGLALLTDAYYDTVDHALLRHGWVLRLRHSDGRTKVTVKGLERHGFGAIHRRVELEGEVEAGSPLHPSSWPAVVRNHVTRLIGPAPELVPVCFLEHARHLRDVPPAYQPDAARRLGELGVEKVTVMAPDRLGRRHGAPEIVATLAEVEFEADSDATDDDLAAVGAALEELPGLSPLKDSKFERALRLVSGHAQGAPTNAHGVQPRMNMAEAGRLVWRQQLAEMLLNEAGARRGDDIEHVHDMRVATRRARAAADIFNGFFDRAALRPMVKGLKRTGGALGPVRDLDVALAKLQRYQRKAPSADQRGLETLAQRWREARAAAYEDLLAWIDSRRYARFLTDFGVFCEMTGSGVRMPKGNGIAPVEVRHIMPLAIVERFAAVRVHEAVLWPTDRSRRPSEAALHALRIDCKRLRYNLEFVRHLLGDEGEALISRLKKLQDHLGDLNDAAVTRDHLRDLQKSGLDHPAVERYAVVQENTIERLRSTFDEVWVPFMALENRRLLMEAAARL